MKNEFKVTITKEDRIWFYVEVEGCGKREWDICVFFPKLCARKLRRKILNQINRRDDKFKTTYTLKGK